MRPVEKWAVESCHTGPEGKPIVVKEDYDPYRTAKPILCKNLGEYCSYCERSLASGDLDVEHVQPKSLPKYAALETKWDNFLLGCRPCNEWVKKKKDVVLADVHLPHRNNTFKSLVYKEGGVVIVNPALTSPAKEHAENLIKLVELDFEPDVPKDGGRNQKRRDTWDKAIKWHENYQEGKIDADSVIDYVKSKGGWSIWFTVFNNHDTRDDEVRRRLIKDFPGTAEKCFDEDNHYEPLDRNPGKTDPV